MRKPPLGEQGEVSRSVSEETEGMRENGFIRPLSQTSLRSVRQLSLKGEPRVMKRGLRRIQFLVR